MAGKSLLCLLFAVGVALGSSGCAAPLVVKAVKKRQDDKEQEQQEQEQQEQKPQQESQQK
jgi:hypothetical protein